MATEIVVSPEQAFVNQALAAFQANPENRDIALARCLYYLQRLNGVADGLEAALPQLTSLASNPLFGRLLGNGR